MFTPKIMFLAWGRQVFKYLKFRAKNGSKLHCQSGQSFLMSNALHPENIDFLRKVTAYPRFARVNRVESSYFLMNLQCHISKTKSSYPESRCAQQLLLLLRLETKKSDRSSFSKRIKKLVFLQMMMMIMCGHKRTCCHCTHYYMSRHM